MKAKLLLLEDESGLNETITEYLQEQGFDVVSVYDGDDPAFNGTLLCV